MKNTFTGGECDYVDCNGKQYYIDTSNTLDCGWETMIFQVKNRVVTDWYDLYCERHNSKDEAMNRHKYIINHLEEYLSNTEEGLFLFRKEKRYL